MSISVRDDHNYKHKIFEDIAVNQRDLVLTLTQTKPSPELTPAQQEKRSYAKAAGERVKTLVNQPAPELSVAEWVSGSPTSIGDLKGKTIALHFWLSQSFDVHHIRLMNILQEVYRGKGLICITIFPATVEIETIKRRIAEQSLSHSIALDQPATVVGADGETFDRYAMGASPPVVLINATGEIAGHVWDSQLEDQIQKLLAD